MTYYEKLQHKATLCRIAAGRTSGRMREIWLKHANTLEIKAANLPIKKAEEFINV